MFQKHLKILLIYDNVNITKYLKMLLIHDNLDVSKTPENVANPW